MFHTELYKVEHELAPDNTYDIFGEKKMSSETCNRLRFSTRTIKCTCYQLETIFPRSKNVGKHKPENIVI